MQTTWLGAATPSLRQPISGPFTVALRAQSNEDSSIDVVSAVSFLVVAAFVAIGVATIGASAYVVVSASLQDKTWTDIGVIALGTVGVFLFFRLAAALCVVDQPQLPPLLGNLSAVGSCEVSLPATGGRGRCFYPADRPEQSCAEAPYLTDGLETSEGMASLVGFKQTGLGFLLEHLASAPSGCWANAVPAASCQGTLPLLVYSHGFGGNMDMSSYFFRQLASHGVVVLALEHTDGTASRTLQDGVPLSFNPFLMSPSEQQSRRAVEFLSAVSALPPDVAALLRPDAVFFGGHSYGGPSAILASLVAERRGSLSVRGVLLHDPAVALVGVTELPRAPVLTFVSEEYDANGVRAGATYACRGAMHGNFVDAPLWAPIWVMRLVSLLIPAAGSAEPVGLHLALARAAAGFMSREEGSSGFILKDDDPVFQRRWDGEFELAGGRSLS